MQGDVAYRLNSPQVIGETVEGELVMINLERGTYYSTDGSGVAVWNLVEQGLSMDAVVTAALSIFAADPREVEPAVRRFLAHLLEEQLIVPVDGADSAALCDKPTLTPGSQPFVPPVLNVYADMADILLLDPVHDVDESGWPRPKASPEQP